MTLDENAFIIDASYWHGLTVEYDAIDSIEYRTDLSTGVRASGFGSARLQMGLFNNTELGNYTRYTYTGADSVILLQVDDSSLVLALQTAEETEILYQQLLTKIQ